MNKLSKIVKITQVNNKNAIKLIKLYQKEKYLAYLPIVLSIALLFFIILSSLKYYFDNSNEGSKRFNKYFYISDVFETLAVISNLINLSIMILRFNNLMRFVKSKYRIAELIFILLFVG